LKASREAFLPVRSLEYSSNSQVRTAVRADQIDGLPVDGRLVLLDLAIRNACRKNEVFLCEGDSRENSMLGGHHV
jgi:hypothetical protein